MLHEGIARRSEGPYASPLHTVPKRGNGWRPCGDYHALNTRTIPIKYPIRHMQDLAHRLHGSTTFSVLELVTACTPILVNPDDVVKTAMFEFPFMSFGLRNAGQTFQRFIDDVVRGLDFCFAYCDNILVFPRNEEDHRQHLHQLFQRLDNHGLLVNVQKSTLGSPLITFLGHQVSSEGTRPLPDHILALKNDPRPNTAKDLRRFLGMLNFYRRFVPKAATYQAPLHDALAGLHGNQSVTWTAALT